MTMRRWWRPLRRLQWQLTFSYILVTVVAALTLIVAATALTAVTLQPKQTDTGFIDKGVVQSVAYNVAPYVEPYMEQQPPDLTALARRLTSMTQSTPSDKTQNIPPAPAGTPDALMVLARANVLVAQSQGNDAAIPAVLADAQVRSAIQAAWAGQQNSEALAAHLPDNRTVATSALSDYSGQIVGVVLGVYSVPSAQAVATAAQNSQAKAANTVLSELVPGLLLFILGTSVLGIVTGMVFSRGLTRRLRRIAAAAHAWSRGELQVAIADGAHDEIGDLARDLNDMAEELQQLVMARQALAVVAERHRLARDLHDSIKQQLFVMTMLIGAARANSRAQPAVAQTLGDAEQIATQAHQELTALIRALRPVAMADKRFGAALGELVASWSSSSGIAVVTQVAATLTAPPEAEKALFRVAQETLANVARHSGATTITVTAYAEGGTLHLVIADDGHGFAPDHHGARGFGLTSMRERMEAVGGMLLVHSDTTGTRIVAQCPLTVTKPDDVSQEVTL